jgi:hypothetical protein
LAWNSRLASVSRAPAANELTIAWFHPQERIPHISAPLRRGFFVDGLGCAALGAVLRRTAPAQTTGAVLARMAASASGGRGRAIWQRARACTLPLRLFAVYDPSTNQSDLTLSGANRTPAGLRAIRIRTGAPDCQHAGSCCADHEFATPHHDNLPCLLKACRCRMGRQPLSEIRHAPVGTR